MAGLTKALRRAAIADRLSNQPGFLQSLDARAKLLSLVLLLAGDIASRSLLALAALLVLSVVLAAGLRAWDLFRPAWIGVLLFAGTVSLPAVFFQAGWRSAGFILVRSEISSTLTLLLVLSTSWPKLLKGLRALRVPRPVVGLLGMTLRYILLLAETAANMFEARKSRVVAHLDARARRRITVQTAGALLNKSARLSDEVHAAMESRGFRGEMHLIQQDRFRWPDALSVLCSGAVALAVAAF